MADTTNPSYFFNIITSNHLSCRYHCKIQSIPNVLNQVRSYIFLIQYFEIHHITNKMGNKCRIKIALKLNQAMQYFKCLMGQVLMISLCFQHYAVHPSNPMLQTTWPIVHSWSLELEIGSSRVEGTVIWQELLSTVYSIIPKV